ncbi:MAG: NUDIX hydrolase [Bacteroidetes bacterium]|nr:NUDIX hydrolase [Bacteroidota bacterium]MCW5895311.1 NUDIX hydrolase [Bacteroidota bacterium]
MSLKRWKKISEETLFKNNWWTYKRDTFELPNGKVGEYNYVHIGGSAMVVPIMKDGRVLLVNQYRYLNEKESLEFPCGSVKDGMSHDETAWRELAEETGYSSSRFFLAGEFNPYNGVTNEICKVYIARELQHVGGTPDETEEFELLPLTADEIDTKIRNGEIWDGMTIAAWAIVKTNIDV